MWISDLVKAATSVSDLKAMYTDAKSAYEVFKSTDGTTAEKLAAAEASLADSDFKEQLIEVIQKFTDDDGDAKVELAINALANALEVLAGVETSDSDDDDSE